MTNIIVPFQFGFAEIRIVVIDNEPWLVAKDVCDVLGLIDVGRSCERLDEDEKGTHSVSTLGGNQDMIIISESGFYRLVMTSRKPSVKKFQKWEIGTGATLGKYVAAQHQSLGTSQHGKYQVKVYLPSEVSQTIEAFFETVLVV